MQFLQQAHADIKEMEKRVERLRLEVAQKDGQIQEMKRARRHVKFDEEIIAEHDKERGTRMKIDEPKTPFVREEPFSFPDTSGREHGHEEDDIPILNNAVVFQPGVQVNVPRPFTKEEEEDSDNKGELAQSADSAASKPRLGRPQGLNIELVQSSLEAVKNKKDFEDARSKHYNEYDRLKAWREKQHKKKQGNKNDEDDEDEDEDKHDEDEDKHDEDF